MLQNRLLGPDPNATKLTHWLQMCISQALKILCASILSLIMMRDQVAQNTVRARFIEKDEITLGVQVEKF